VAENYVAENYVTENYVTENYMAELFEDLRNAKEHARRKKCTMSAYLTWLGDNRDF
jgi:hypothetical protein